ncbi:MAG TPA: LacI family DNA-binding transcriptional regulator [Mycobacterium sp.]
MSAKAVTLKDVAAIAGVDESTVSRVLRGGGKVSDETRTRIVEAAERLDFRPNALAQSLARGESKVIGVLVEDVSDIFSALVLRGAESVFAASDLATLVYDAQESPGRRAELIRKLQARRVDGVLVIGRGSAAPYTSISDRFQVPVVYAFGVSSSALDTSFVPDDFAVGRMAGEHLLGLGSRHVAHITAAEDTGAQNRAAGLMSVLEAAGRALAGRPLLGDWSARWGATAVGQLIDQDTPFDAIFCGNDLIALGAFARLREAGLRIPADVAVLGHDHFVRERPSEESKVLSTIDPNRSELGARAATTLVRAMTGGALPQGLQMVAPTLVVGLTTTPNSDAQARRAYDLLEMLL